MGDRDSGMATSDNAADASTQRRAVFNQLANGTYRWQKIVPMTPRGNNEDGHDAYLADLSDLIFHYVRKHCNSSSLFIKFTNMSVERTFEKMQSSDNADVRRVRSLYHELREDWEDF